MQGLGTAELAVSGKFNPSGMSQKLLPWKGTGGYPALALRYASGARL